MSRSRRVAAFVASATALVVVAGCSSSSNDSKDSSSAPKSSSSPASSTSSTSASTAAASSAASGGDLEGALLTATDIGTGFRASPSASAPDSPLPCTPGAKPLFQQFPPTQKAKQTFANAGQTIGVDETIGTYDTATARQAFAAAVKGFACTSGTLDGATVKIVKRPGTGSTADAESAAWDFTNGKVLGTAAILRIGTKIAGVSFVATPETANSLDVGAVLQKAATKVAALG